MGPLRALPPRRGLRLLVFAAATVGAYFGLRALGLPGWSATLLGLAAGLIVRIAVAVLVERPDPNGPHGS